MTFDEQFLNDYSFKFSFGECWDIIPFPSKRYSFYEICLPLGQKWIIIKRKNDDHLIAVVFLNQDILKAIYNHGGKSKSLKFDGSSRQQRIMQADMLHYKAQMHKI